MKTIEIITAQNVVLQYELAGLKDRALAFLLDIVCVSVALSILSVIGMALFGGTETSVMVVTVLLSCVFIFYSLAFELWNNGQSIGKMALRIRVIKVVGGRATFSDYAARWVFRLVDIYLSSGAIASILIMSSSKGQRIGDVVANTTVVKITPKMDLNLQDLLNIHKQTSYTPQYQQARKLQEEDALLIKLTLERYRRFGNDAHDEALQLLTDTIRKKLDIENPQTDQAKFLQTVLRDYVVLTR